MKYLSTAAISMLFIASFSASADKIDHFQICLQTAFADADSSTTVGEIRHACEEKVGKDSLKAETIVLDSGDGAITERFRDEALTEEHPFVLTPYYPNYVLLGAYNFSQPNSAIYQQATGDEDFELDNVELDFQLSVKVPVVKDMFGKNGDLYAAYTNRSFWQAYNTENSSPFRETNHQPELWTRFYNSWDLWGFRNVVNDIGIVHQSNGRGGDLSRSWNRIYARFMFEKDDLAITLQPWYRIKEDEDKDNNPDIEDYLGNFELVTAYKPNQHEFSLMLRNNLDFDENHGAAQLDWSFPIHDRMRGYVQWFNGYGQSLIDYDHSVNVLGVGISLTDWL